MWHHRLNVYCDVHTSSISKKLIIILAITILITCVCVYALDASLKQSKMLQRFGTEGIARLHLLNSLIIDIKTKTDKEKIHQINQFFNTQVIFQEDRVLWNNLDYWSTPLETLGKAGGDCEDYAIAKYFGLLEAGVDVKKLRLIYVKAQIGDSSSRLFQAHMVLGYYETDDSIPYILDNLISSVELANDRPDLKPVFSFNSDGIWVGNKPATADPTARLSRWRDLLQRTQADGF
jgi:predicted transglutaminase-like cysteine proteinase